MSISSFENGKVKLWTQLEGVESEALSQLRNIARLPWVFRHVAVMPDVHYGKGATVGSVIAMKDALAPAGANEVAQQEHLSFHAVIDNGATEFGGVPTLTCIAIGPGRSELIDGITGHLRPF